jgi:hypothetical protein
MRAMSRSSVVAAIVVFLCGWLPISAQPESTGEVWSCTFAGFRGTVNPLPPNIVHSDFRIEGNRLFQEGPGTTEPFHILENSANAIVAAKGGTVVFFEEGARVASSIVMIKKDTGEFVFAILEIGPANERTTGTCHLKAHGTAGRDQ